MRESQQLYNNAIISLTSQDYQKSVRFDLNTIGKDGEVKKVKQNIACIESQICEHDSTGILTVKLNL